MRLSRLVLGGALFAGGALALGGGCQDPTQVTLDISLDRRARCDEIPSGAAITVGAEPASTESQIGQGFVHARTTSCDFGTGHIGTLVVTPSDEGKGAVIVVVGYKGNDPTSCKPPSYTGCIVARRRFTFAEHTRLRMPIVIDPDCANVPCDAFSTCSRGLCVDSQTDCANGECETPGVLPDGGVDEASVVTPDAGGPRDGDTDTGPIVEAGRDAPEDAPPGTVCGAAGLVCGGVRCGAGAASCCDGACQPSCAGDPLCCGPSECASDQTCERTDLDASVPGRCRPKVTTGPSCTLQGITCGGLPCSGNACCADDPAQCFNGPQCAMPENQYCCTPVDCPTGYACNRVGASPGLCMPHGTAPYCDVTKKLVCNGTPCTEGTFCCTMDPDATTCHADPCGSPEDQRCCKNEDCPAGYTCSSNGTLGTCQIAPPAPPSCDGLNRLTCGGVPCATQGKTCCGAFGEACSTTCMEGDQLCCHDGECPFGERCDKQTGAVGRCVQGMVDAGGQQPLTYPYCEGDTLHCSATAICTGTCCGAVVAQCFDDAGACLGQAYCCNDSHCPAGQLCNIPQLGQAVPPGRCE